MLLLTHSEHSTGGTLLEEARLSAHYTVDVMLLLLPSVILTPQTASRVHQIISAE